MHSAVRVVFMFVDCMCSYSFRCTMGVLIIVRLLPVLRHNGYVYLVE